MKKDITIPKVEGVYIAIVNEYNDSYKTNSWNAYIINDKDVPIDTVLIVTKGYDAQKETSLMRHKLEKLPPKSYAKVEWLQEDVLGLNNEFKISFFEGTTMFDKVYVFPKHTITKATLQDIPIMPLKGVLPQ